MLTLNNSILYETEAQDLPIYIIGFLTFATLTSDTSLLLGLLTRVMLTNYICASPCLVHIKPYRNANKIKLTFDIMTK